MIQYPSILQKARERCAQLYGKQEPVHMRATGWIPNALKFLTCSLDRQNQQSLTACPMLRGLSVMAPSAPPGSTSSSRPIICCPLSWHASATLSTESNCTCSHDAFFPRSCFGHLTAACMCTQLVPGTGALGVSISHARLVHTNQCTLTMMLYKGTSHYNLGGGVFSGQCA